MSKLIKLASAALALVVGVQSYAIIEPRGCSGVATCVEFVGGAEFGATFTDNTNSTPTSCLFGQNSNESNVPDDEFCTVPCDEDIDHFCICLSEGVSQSGKDKEAYFVLLISVVMAVLVLPMIAVICVRRQKFNKLADKWLEDFEKAGKDENKVGLQPTPPHELTCWAILVILLVVSIVMGARAGSIRNSAFWAGCGARFDVLNDEA